MWPFVENFSTGLSGLHSIIPEDYFLIFFEKILVFWYFLALSFKLSGVLAENIDGTVKTVFYVYRLTFEAFEEIPESF